MGKNSCEGKLYLCPTPIGNLEDITVRVISCLKEVDLIACEDTRRTQKLLNHFEISANMISYHKFNQEERGRQLIDKLNAGDDIALVSDAGTPGISDPGRYLVRDAVSHGFQVMALPGPSAATTALAASGLDTDSFLFIGFLPEKGRDRKLALERVITSNDTVILYENAPRLIRTLNELKPQLGSRQIVIAKELTKVHEEYMRGTSDEMLRHLENNQIQGEITLLIEGCSREEDDFFNKWSIEEHLNKVMEEGFTKKDAIKLVSQLRGVPKREVYQKALELEKNKDEH